MKSSLIVYTCYLYFLSIHTRKWLVEYSMIYHSKALNGKCVCRIDFHFVFPHIRRFWDSRIRDFVSRKYFLPKFSHYITIGRIGGKLAGSGMQARLLSMLLPGGVVGGPVVGGRELPDKMQAGKLNRSFSIFCILSRQIIAWFTNSSRICVHEIVSLKCSHYIPSWSFSRGRGVANSSMQARLFSMLLPALVVGSPVGSGRELPKQIQV